MSGDSSVEKVYDNKLKLQVTRRLYFWGCQTPPT